MSTLRLLLQVLAALLPCVAVSSQDLPTKLGHSGHGAAYDTGPRQRPWRMTGIGESHFPITTSVPEVQEWYDQGNTLLHSFWYFEAERTFRWCIKLDPKCAMAYLGVLRCRLDQPLKAQSLLDQAVANMPHVSDREQHVIDAWRKSFHPSLERPKLPGMLGLFAGNKQLAKELERLIIAYPDDAEIKMLLMHQHGIVDRLGADAMLRDVLDSHPDHPGAHHLRIHNWDSVEFGHVALDSCKAYGPIAPNVGHANHMPGHIYTKLGMWHEGAISLDGATRVEKAYMQKQLVFPFNAWNYAHNRNFLAYAQEMLGMPSLALQGARDLLNAPLDPDRNGKDTELSVHGQGIAALRRVLVRYERWDELLQADSVPWQKSPTGDLWRRYCLALAHLGKGQTDQAETLFHELRAPSKAPAGMPPEIAAAMAAAAGSEAGGPDASDRSPPGADPGSPSADGGEPPAASAFLGMRRKAQQSIMEKELEARLRHARGDTLAAIAAMQVAAELEFAQREEDNDPPPYPRCLYVVLGEWHLDLGSSKLAIAAFEKSLKVLRNNGFALAGLARAHHALGNMDQARTFYGRMLHVWANAESGIWQRDQAMALGLQAEPLDVSPETQRNYRTETLERLGPTTWQPYAAPTLDAVSSTGERVGLKQFAGKNVLLVFYLNEQCVHCVEQLREIERRAAEFRKRDVVLLAISSDSPSKNAESELSGLPFELLSDDNAHSNAIRWLSYDEFEDLELHSTNYIDRTGRLRWARTGGDPFMNMDFLLAEIDRIERIEQGGSLKPPVGHAAGR